MTAAVPHFPPTQPIEEDLFCTGCQYNLRTRTPSDRCPECGLPIARTLEHYQTHRGAIARSGYLRAAAWIFAAVSFLSIVPLAVIYTLIFFTPSGSPWVIFLHAVTQVISHGCFAIAVAAGVYLGAASVSKLVLSPGIRSALALACFSYAALTVMPSLGLVLRFIRFHGRMGRFGPLMFVAGEQRFTGSLFCLLLAALGFYVMRRLAESVASRKLLNYSLLAFTLLGAQAGLSFAIYVFLGMWHRWWWRSVDFTRLFFAVDLPSTAIFLFMGVYWMAVARIIGEKSAPAASASEVVTAGAAPLPPEKKVEDFLEKRRGGTS